MIQHHYKSVCGTKTYQPKNEITFKNVDVGNKEASTEPTVIDDLHNPTGKTFNLYYWSNERLPLVEFVSMVLEAASNVEGFDYINVDHLLASDFLDEVSA